MSSTLCTLGLENSKEFNHLSKFTQYFVLHYEEKLQYYCNILENAIQGVEGRESVTYTLDNAKEVFENVCLAFFRQTYNYVKNREDKKMIRGMCKLIYDPKNKHNVRNILVEACFEIFKIYEAMIMHITGDTEIEDGTLIAMKLIAEAAVDKVINYCVLKKPNETLTVELIIEALISSNFKTYKNPIANAFEKFASFIRKPIKISFSKVYNIRNGDEITAVDIYSKAGIVNENLYYKNNEKNRKTDTENYGYRLALDTEKTTGLIQLKYEEEENASCIADYTFILASLSDEQKQNTIEKLLDEIETTDEDFLAEIKKCISDSTDNVISEITQGRIFDLELCKNLDDIVLKLKNNQTIATPSNQNVKTMQDLKFKKKVTHKNNQTTDGTAGNVETIQRNVYEDDVVFDSSQTCIKK